MSTDEQDLIFGRLTRQAAECARNIAALEVKLSEFSQELQKLSSQLNGTWNPRLRPVTAIDEAKTAVLRAPEKQTILDTLVELQFERRRAAEIAGHLAGLKP